MSLIDIPVSDQVVNVFAIDTQTFAGPWFCVYSSAWTYTFATRAVALFSMLLHPNSSSPSTKARNVSIAQHTWFLIRHTSGRQVLFDLGLRHDWTNLPPQKVEAIHKNGWRITSGKALAEVLAEHGLDVEQGAFDAVIWSHPHLDHVGDMSIFPRTTTLVVGKEFNTEHMPGYPLNTKSGVWNSDSGGCDVQQVNFEEGLTIGGLPAHDFFGDGSFFLLDTPGHMKSHMCGLARVSADPPRFVFISRIIRDRSDHPATALCQAPDRDSVW